MSIRAAASCRRPWRARRCNKAVQTGGQAGTVKTLDEIGAQEDGDIDVAFAALALAAHANPDKPAEQYTNHLLKLARDVADRHAGLLAGGAEDDAGTQLAALKHILHDQEAYLGDSEQYDNLDNANLMRVIDRRKGLPIAIALLYIHAGRAQGWRVDGLNFPGHVLVRIERSGQRLIFDPFHGCLVMQAPELRALLKATMGPQAELSVSYYDIAANRDMLLRLQNNIKLRQIDAEDYEGALATVEAMRLIAPAEYKLLFDAGILSARIGRPGAAITLLEEYARNPLSPRERQDAEALLAELRAMVN